MITMENFATRAVKKLEGEKGKVAGNKEKAMAGAVFAAIKDFCLQEEEFAQAVVQGGNFVDCMKKVASGVGSSISDLDAYKKAVQFYFPGAEVRMQLTIDLIGKAAGKDSSASLRSAQNDSETAVVAAPSLTLNLADYF